MTAISTTPAVTRRGALWRAVRLMAPHRERFLVSTLLGTGAVLAAVALLGVAGALISRAALRPDVLALTTLSVTIRGLAMARAGLRYLERIVSHDLAFRVLTDLRVRFYSRLVPLVPEGLRALRGGDVLSRFVSDVDSLQDVYLRALGPPLVAIGVIIGVAIFMAIVLPWGAVVLVLALLVAGVGVPALAALATRASGRRQGPARAELINLSPPTATSTRLRPGFEPVLRTVCRRGDG